MFERKQRQIPGESAFVLFWVKCLNIIYNYNKIADLNKIKRIIQIKLSKIYKKVLTNTNVNAIIMTSKEKRNKKRKSFNS